MSVFSVSGSKVQAIMQLEQDLGQGKVTNALKSLVTALPGTQVSLSGNVSGIESNEASNLTLSGSSWTP